MQTRRLVIFSVALLVTLIGAGCAKGDLEKMCNAEQLSGAAAIQSTDEKRTKIATWLDANIKSTAGKNVLGALGAVAADQKGALLREGAKEVGYTGPCPWADALTAAHPPKHGAPELR